MSEPWYADGLRFTCTQCGDCCTGEPGFVWVTDEEIAAIAEFRKEPVGEVTQLYTRRSKGRRTLKEKANGDCVFFERPRLHDLFRPPAAVPHVAVLGKQHRHARRLGTDRTQLPGVRRRRTHPRRGNHPAAQSDQDVTVPLFPREGETSAEPDSHGPAEVSPSR